MAVASALLIAFIGITWARTRNEEVREGYTDRVYAALRKAGMVQGGAGTAEYGEREQEVFEAFLKVHGTPPTDSAMRHYVAVAKKYALDKTKLTERMKSDLPSDEDFEHL